MSDRTVRYFLDAEFIEDGVTISLVSIGVCCEDGREFYAESTQAPWHRASDWVSENVRSHLRNTDDVLAPDYAIAQRLLEFVGPDEPEFWADYASYDWVVLAQLFGTMMDLPKGWPMRVMDVQQFADHIADMCGSRPDLPEPDNAHDALSDARNVRQRWMICRAAFNELTEAP